MTTNTEDYRDLIDTLALYAEAENRLATIQTEIDQILIDAIDARRKDYAELQEAKAQAEAAIELIATRNKDAWFAKKKSLVTPYGTVGFRSTPYLDIPNEELTIALVEMYQEDRELYLRRETSLNKEAIETLDDASLTALKIRRATKETCTIKPAKVDLGKATKSAAETAA